MSEMSHEKSFEATPSRLERARREGDLPSAGDAVVFGAFAGGTLALALVASPAAGAAAAILTGATHMAPPDAGDAVLEIGAYVRLGWCALAPAVGSLAGAVAMQQIVGGRIALRFPRIDGARLNPVNGLKSIFSRETALAIAKSLAAGIALGCATAPVVITALVKTSRGASAWALAASISETMHRIAVAAIVVAVLFALLDVALQRARWRRRLRMDLDEVRRDLKENEGDPLLRSRRRTTHGALIRGSLERVREAAFVVTNPTHVAIALAYAPPRIAVPLVLVRAIDRGALLVKRRARELGIPIIEDATLARTLLAITQAGTAIPQVAYDAVARIVAALLRAGKISKAG